MTERKAIQSKGVGRVLDARGRRVTVLDPLTLRLVGGEHGIPSDQLLAMCGRIGQRMTWVEIWVFGSPRVMVWAIWLAAFLLALLVALCAGLAMVRSVQLFKMTGYVLPMCVCLGFLFILWQIAKRLRTRRAAEIMLEFKRCPHCGYDLRMLPVDPDDGATVCPECGGAWGVEEEVQRKY